MSSDGGPCFCPACGFDLRLIDPSRCPECGAGILRPATAAPAPNPRERLAAWILGGECVLYVAGVLKAAFAPWPPADEGGLGVLGGVCSLPLAVPFFVVLVLGMWKRKAGNVQAVGVVVITFSAMLAFGALVSPFEGGFDDGAWMVPVIGLPIFFLHGTLGWVLWRYGKKLDQAAGRLEYAVRR